MNLYGATSRGTLPPRPLRGRRSAGALAALVLHLVIVAALMSHAPARQALFEAAPIMVELLTPAPPPRRPEPPKTRPVIRPQPVTSPQPLPTIFAPPEAPSLLVAPPAPPIAPQPVPISAPPAPPVVSAAPGPATPAPLTPPVFDAAYLDNPPPAYPAASRRLHEQGRVVLRVHVTPAGRADEVQILSSSGSMRLDESARDTVTRWRFVPARRGEAPVAAWVLIPISFSLER